MMIKRKVFQDDEDFNQEELKEIMIMSNEMKNMNSREVRVLLKAIEIYKETKDGY